MLQFVESLLSIISTYCIVSLWWKHTSRVELNPHFSCLCRSALTPRALGSWRPAQTRRLVYGTRRPVCVCRSWRDTQMRSSPQPLTTRETPSLQVTRTCIRSTAASTFTVSIFTMSCGLLFWFELCHTHTVTNLQWCGHGGVYSVCETTFSGVFFSAGSKDNTCRIWRWPKEQKVVHGIPCLHGPWPLNCSCCCVCSSRLGPTALLCLLWNSRVLCTSSPLWWGTSALSQIRWFRLELVSLLCWYELC